MSKYAAVRAIAGVLLASSAASGAVSGASAACPDLSGVYEISYTVAGQSFQVVSTVTQQGCQTMKAVNDITGPYGKQGYTRQWIADGVFRRKDTASVENAIFTPMGLMTTEVRSPIPGDPTPAPPYFSRRDLVSLDVNRNLVNTEERFDENGNSVGTSRFVYVRRLSR